MTNGTAEDGYFLVKLTKGPVWRPGRSFDLLVLQIRHMRNLWRLRRMKKALWAGPVTDGGPLRGIVVFKAASEDEVRTLVETDPAVKAGRLSYEISEL